MTQAAPEVRTIDRARVAELRARILKAAKTLIDRFGDGAEGGDVVFLKNQKCKETCGHKCGQVCGKVHTVTCAGEGRLIECPKCKHLIEYECGHTTTVECLNECDHECDHECEREDWTGLDYKVLVNDELTDALDELDLLFIQLDMAGVVVYGEGPRGE